MRSLGRVKAIHRVMIAIMASGLLLIGCSTKSKSGGSDGSHVKVFVTSEAFNGNFSGLAGADAECVTAATNAGLSGSWTAWLSDGAAFAISRIFDGDTRYQLLDGTVIADDVLDLLNGTLDAPINVDENGTVVRGAIGAWTGTDSDGVNVGLPTCANWTSNSNSDTAQIGFVNSDIASWTEGGNHLCDVFNRLYCFANEVSD